MSTKEIDMSWVTKDDGYRYEDRYGGYIDIIKEVALTPKETPIVCLHPPWSWVPLLTYLNTNIVYPRNVFDHCRIVENALTGIRLDDINRTMVEVLSAFRPETVDCLWKCDCQWETDRPNKITEREFIVTNSSSYQRREVLDYLSRLATYVPPRRKVLLVPCAADKPYPSPLHRECLRIINGLDDRVEWYMANVTGVLGIVPMDLWDIMPWYDSGIPNQWRVSQVLGEYFKKYPHYRIVVYSDFYGPAINTALTMSGQQSVADWAVKLDEANQFDYLDLMSDSRLQQLDSIMRGKS